MLQEDQNSMYSLHIQWTIGKIMIKYDKNKWNKLKKLKLLIKMIH